MRRVVWLILFSVALSLGVPTLASGQDQKKIDFGDKIVVIQRKPFMREGRLEMVPLFMGSINDSMVEQMVAAANINFHITEWLYVGLTGGWQDWRFISREATGFSKAYERTIDATDAIPAVSVVNGYAGGVVGFVPLYGKFALFNSAILHWDFSVALGGGIVHSRANDLLGAGIITAGQRIFILDWLSLNLEVKGLLYYEELRTVAGKEGNLFNQWQAGIGVGFWVPPSFSYSTD